ncbi:MAG: rhodanese-like domain-containing protein [Paraglaciecola sp.]|uniref:rhodanese-like domain-containing protein n=1 Tax=Paraglaciecola sp. TaxID=1920173 RepID=UPI003298EA1D
MVDNAPPNIDKIKLALRQMLHGTAPTISTDKLADLISCSSDWCLLDCRESDEFEVSHLPNAKWVGYKNFTMSNLNGIPKDTKIALYCSIGVRSEQIAEKLIASGFSKVWNLYGGIFAWANEQKSLVDHNSNPTFVVHGYDQKWGELVNNPVFTKVLSN